MRATMPMAHQDSHRGPKAGEESPLHRLVNHCEEQLHCLQDRIHSLQQTWLKDLHHSPSAAGVKEEEVLIDSANCSSNVQFSEGAEDGSSVQVTRQVASSKRHCSRFKVVKHVRESDPSATLAGFLGSESSRGSKGTLKITGDRGPQQPSRFSLLPFASIRLPDTEVPLPNQPLNPFWLPNSDSSCRKGLQARSTAQPFVAQVKKTVIQALSALLQRPRSAVLPEPEVKLSQWEPFQGDTVAVLVKVPRPRGLIDQVQLAIRSRFPALGPLVKVAVEKQDVPVFPRGEDGSWRALIPTTPLDKSGTRELQVLVQDGRHSPYDRVIYLKNRDYIIEKISLPERKKGLIGGATAEELAAMGDLRTVRSPQQLWKGPFLRPSDGLITTYYGVQRFYNDKYAEGYYHRGVDYGADTGSPVVSPADGRVALVGHEEDGFRLHGNCIGLDHGQGVVSTMLHLETVSVKEGELVKAGQVLGTVGETGIATGPHLHWGLYVNGECIDPDPWMQEQFWL